MSLWSSVLGYFFCDYNTRHLWARRFPPDDIRGDSTCMRCGEHVEWDDTPEPIVGGSYRVAAQVSGSDVKP